MKENIKAPRRWPLCGEFTGNGEFPAQRASYAENVSIWWWWINKSPDIAWKLSCTIMFFIQGEKSWNAFRWFRQHLNISNCLSLNTIKFNLNIEIFQFERRMFICSDRKTQFVPNVLSSLINSSDMAWICTECHFKGKFYPLRGRSTDDLNKNNCLKMMWEMHIEFNLSGAEAGIFREN